MTPKGRTPKGQKPPEWRFLFVDISGRGERIRTSDSCVPNAVLYQAELHPESALHDDLSLLSCPVSGVGKTKGLQVQ